jgi:hypothetical protein
LCLEYRDEHHAVDVASLNRSTAGALDITREALNAMAVETIPTFVRLGVPTATSLPGWFVGAGDNRDHAIRSWIPDRSGYLSAACGKPSAQAGRSVNRPCPDCDKKIAVRAQDQSVTC